MSTIVVSDSTPITQLYNSNQSQNVNNNYNNNDNYYNTNNNNNNYNNLQSQSFFNNQNTLPSRDIPQNTIYYTNDEETLNNHIPQSQPFNGNNNNSIHNNTRNEENFQDYNDRRYKKDILTDILYYQDYIFLICLYVLFQLPLVNDIIKLNFHTLGMCDLDGNMNIKCHILIGLLLTVLYRFCLQLFSSY